MRTSDSVSPRPTTIIAGTAGVALLVGAITGATINAMVDVPERSDFVAVSSERASTLDVRIDDPHDVLDAADEEQLLRDAERIRAPDVVSQLSYLVLAENDDNVNDTVEEYARIKRPELIAADDDHFADGVLIVGVGLDPRQSFVFAGEDVADQVHLHEGAHLDEAVEAIQPGVKDNNIPAGLFAGASTAVDAEQAADTAFSEARTDHFAGVIGSGFGSGAGAGGLAVAAALRVRSRNRKALQARADYEALTTEYAQLAGRLDSISIRAHSLTSPLADRNLKHQWESVRTRFLGLHDSVDSLGGLSRDSSDAEFRQRSKELREAASSAESVDIAEDNINRLFELEQGDVAVRREEAYALRDDIREAQLEVDDVSDPLHARFDELSQRSDALASAPSSDTFLDTFAVLLRDYQQALTQLRNEKFSDVEESEELEIPRIDSRDYRPGYGYHGFAPYWALSAWHSSNVSAAQSSSGSTNTSFSSGFSGAGGSSSF